MCACLYVPACQCGHVVASLLSVHESWWLAGAAGAGAGAAGAPTGLGGGQGRRMNFHLSVRPSTKLYFWQPRTTPEPQNKYITYNTGIIPEGKNVI
jgi:hypothetical protein